MHIYLVIFVYPHPQQYRLFVFIDDQLLLLLFYVVCWKFDRNYLLLYIILSYASLAIPVRPLFLLTEWIPFHPIFRYPIYLSIFDLYIIIIIRFIVGNKQDLTGVVASEQIQGLVTKGN